MSAKSARCDVLEALRAETVAAMNARLDAPAGPLRLAGAKSSQCALDAHVALKIAAIRACQEDNRPYRTCRAVLLTFCHAVRHCTLPRLPVTLRVSRALCQLLASAARRRPSSLRVTSTDGAGTPDGST